MKMRSLWLVLLMSSILIGLSECSLLTSPVDYNTEVKPILNQKCISCHGGVKANGGFSLLSRDRALAETESEKPAIIPGSASESEFIRRLHLEDPEERMPFGGEPLTNKEIKTLTRWVNQGAKWGLHWAYEPLEESIQTLTMGKSEDKNYIDAQIEMKLKEIELKPNPKAGKAELLRRVSFDLIGMPASATVRDAYLFGKLEYEDLVDTLLSDPAFGEKWATMWLDVARYADSKGFERDQSRNIWRYRDYVIEAFNKDKPYNDFLVEQLAGDLLENPTKEQYIATGFHRNTQTNDEGGTDNEEFRVKAVMDRVNTTWEGLLGTTMACVQCHGHPYDPFPHKDYYESYAFFNNTRDADTAKDFPILNFLDSLSQEKLDELTTWIEETENSVRAKEIENFVELNHPIYYSIETDQLVNADLYDTKYLGFRRNGSARLPQVNLSEHEVMWIKYMPYVGQNSLKIHLDSLEGEVIASFTLPKTGKYSPLYEVKLPLDKGVRDLFFEYNSPELKSSNQRGLGVDWFYFGDAFPGEASAQRNYMWNTFGDLLAKNHSHTLVFTENPEDMRRKSYLFDRGNWQIHAEEVQPGTPGILPSMNESLPKNRLGYAKWIASPENPLTSRTYVNRIWEQIFGRGIVRTVEDLGSQGDKPTHQELLNRLSYDFTHDMEWSTKTLLKEILLSAAYQQSSQSSVEKNDKDPYNAYLSRGPRNRLTAEQIRDQALYLSDLLSEKMYGPPVKPYQPEGIWNSPYSNEEWIESEGENRYRRAIYTMIKRTAIYPSMETFDMASRQVCTSRRIASNTPLQALVTLNDPVYIELSTAIGNKMLAKDISKGIQEVYFNAMNKEIDAAKLEILNKLYLESLAEISGEGDSKEIAAMTVANALINLDDLLNK